MSRPQVTSKYYSGQGVCLMGTRNVSTGKPEGLSPIGNVPELTLNIALTTEEHKESWSGARGIDDISTTETAVDISVTLESVSGENLVLGLNGVLEDIVGAADGDETLTLHLDKWTYLDKVAISNVAITGAVEDTDFEVNAEGGAIKMLVVTPLVDAAAIQITYDYAAQTNIEALLADNPERYFIFDGINTKGGKYVRVEIPRLQTQPFSDFAFIGDGFQQFTLNAKALADPFITDAAKSKFFRELIQA